MPTRILTYYRSKLRLRYFMNAQVKGAADSHRVRRAFGGQFVIVPVIRKYMTAQADSKAEK